MSAWPPRYENVFDFERAGDLTLGAYAKQLRRDVADAPALEHLTDEDRRHLCFAILELDRLASSAERELRTYPWSDAALRDHAAPADIKTERDRRAWRRAKRLLDSKLTCLAARDEILSGQLARALVSALAAGSQQSADLADDGRKSRATRAKRGSSRPLPPRLRDRNEDIRAQDRDLLASRPELTAAARARWIVGNRQDIVGGLSARSVRAIVRRQQK